MIAIEIRPLVFSITAPGPPTHPTSALLTMYTEALEPADIAGIPPEVIERVDGDLFVPQWGTFISSN